MATSDPPPTEADPSALMCHSDEVGLCAKCWRKTHRYGRGGNPLCSYCFAAVSAQWGPRVRRTPRA
ncbi:hypothetical protein DN051_04365 [Streptomyces cadmiisoli]|uniref:Uncharacterized protein n=1 Tax=Streptomyces cadmiisoli TaxID=2184053 RepID=A0A2Z4IT04_9ACTN|nr:hypothetical protein DN051_04365 [Streptomyces cadmiisoli]